MLLTAAELAPLATGLSCWRVLGTGRVSAATHPRPADQKSPLGLSSVYDIVADRGSALPSLEA